MNNPARLYCKRPVVITAWRLDGSIMDRSTWPIWLDADSRAQLLFEKYETGTVCPYILITTLEGTMRANVGDYIIKGAFDEIYPVKSSIFDATYEEVIQGETDGNMEG